MISKHENDANTLFLHVEHYNWIELNYIILSFRELVFSICSRGITWLEDQVLLVLERENGLLTQGNVVSKLNWLNNNQ